MTLRQLCELHTALEEQDILMLEHTADMLPLIADLTGSDLFIDIFSPDFSMAFVAAQVKPRYASSLYDRSVVGLAARREDEPAVYHAVELGAPVRDLRAVTQQGSSVRQDVAPIFRNNTVIGVLIREKDISSTLLQNRKYDALKKQVEDGSGVSFLHGGDMDITAMQEANHRIKNSLQLVSSILSIQARQAPTDEIRRLFMENTNRVNAIASTHDIIFKSADSAGVGEVSVKNLLHQLAHNLTMIASANRSIEVGVRGEDIAVSAGSAPSIALVVNELVSNSIRHGYPEKKAGTITITLHPGALYSSISVDDDGCGFDSTRGPASEGLGICISMLTVRDKLGGELHMHSSDRGTRALFDFKMPTPP